jgi:hypothetical protein
MQELLPQKQLRLTQVETDKIRMADNRYSR